MRCQVYGGSFYELPPRVTKDVRSLGLVSDHPAGRGFSCYAAPLLQAVDLDRESEGGDPDGHDKDVDQDGERAADADGLEERLHVGDEDEAADGATEYTGGQDAHDVRLSGRPRRHREGAPRRPSKGSGR